MTKPITPPPPTAMTQTHPLTPPDELLEHWDIVSKLGNSQNALALAYRAGADHELEASVNWLIENQNPRWAEALRTARRPKPPSLKEQAIEQLQALQQCGAGHRDTDKIFRALNADDGDPIVMPSSPADLLIDRVAKALYDAPNTHEGWRSEARAAILEVAAWLTENYARDVASPPPCQMLRNEVNR